MDKDSWKETKEFGYYDYNLLTKVVRNLRNYRQALEDGEHVKSEDAENLEDLLRACVKSNFAGIENTRLYSHTYHGTKKLIEEFTEEGEFKYFAQKGGLQILNLTISFSNAPVLSFQPPPLSTFLLRPRPFPSKPSAAFFVP